ncbi:hypothetical protein [Aneurinibacillus aneurinilyticus]|uniref:hypothetical protein n=1 Tax=Aneurinibacillus aneurinilyticus TaxID=1391 RepID=UPI00366F2E80
MTENTRLLKPEELQEIAERERKATPGPWRYENGLWERGDRRPAVITYFDYDNGEWFIHGDIASEEDAEFIATSRMDIPRLLAHIEAQQAQLSSLCPIGDLDAITSLQTEKEHMAEHIKVQQAEIERLKNTIAFVKYEIGNEMDFAWHRDNAERYEAFEYIQRQFEVIEEAL